MGVHDPMRMIENLRDHLAMHDRHLIFLFGAGTSSSINIAPKPKPSEKPKYKPLIPGIEGLTDICEKAVYKLGEKQKGAWDLLAKQCKRSDCSATIEDMLSRIRMKIDAIGQDEILLGLDLNKLIEIETTICASIAKSVNPHLDHIPNNTPHKNFASWIKKIKRSNPIEIFTTNYDMLFELSFEAARIPVFDGFVGTHHPFFYPECLDDENLLPKSNWIRLWKIHGSVNWVLEKETNMGRIIRSSPVDSGEMILPSHRKYDESRKQPYIGYMDRLSKLLNTEHALLITCGYSFGDEHINAILYGALDNSKTTNIIALQYGQIEKDDKLIQAATERSNLTVIGPNGGVISGTWGIWQLNQPVDDKTYSFMDIAFDSNFQPEDTGSPASVTEDMMGKLRISDFNWFCRFLNSMGVDN